MHYDYLVKLVCKHAANHEITETMNIGMAASLQLLGYEPAGLTMHPPPKKNRSRVGSFFSHRCLVLPKFFPQRKSGFCRRN